MTLQPPSRRPLARLLTGSLAAVALATGPIALAAPALAQGCHHTDPSRDVVLRRSTNATDTAPRPNNRSADITRWTATYAHRTITSTVHLRDVTRGQWEMTWLLQTPHTETTWAVGLAHLDNSRGAELIRNHQKVPCDGLTSHIDRARGTVSISVPRTCLHKPRWVQVDPASDAFDDAGHDYEDNGMRDGTLNDTDIAWGPRLLRG